MVLLTTDHEVEMETISWSLIPGITSHDVTVDGLLVRKISNIFWFLNGVETVCVKS